MQQGEPNYWDGKEEENAAPVPAAAPDPAPVTTGQTLILPNADISWEASEYLQHNNGALWYLVFFFIVALLIIIAVLLQAWTFIAVIVAAAVAGMFHVLRPPRTVRYTLGNDGLQIAERLHPYDEFKSFSVIRDGAFFAVLLIPAKRFSPSTIVYFEEADGEAIVDAFGTRLPMETRDLDLLDQFLRFIRF